jgi:hypothetical protein
MPRASRLYCTWLLAQAGAASSWRSSRSKLDAPAADLAGLAQALEGLDRLFQRVLAAPVQQVEVQVIAAQALQAALAGRRNARAAGVVR